MKPFILVLLFCIFCLTGFGQTPSETILAIAGESFTIRAADLPDEPRRIYLDLANLVANQRKLMLQEQVDEVLLEIEAEQRKVSVDDLIRTEIEAKVADPAEDQIRAVFDANRASIGTKTIAEVKPQIISFLRREPRQKIFSEYLHLLGTRYKVSMVRDVSRSDLKSNDVLAEVGNRRITLADFDARNQPKLADYEGDLYDHLLAALRQVVFTRLLTVDARAEGLAESDIVARELTNKMVEFSDAEQERLQNAMEDRMFAKYNVRFLLEEPVPFVQNISADDDPAEGPADAAVTIVMFSDFQCPACASVHPLLKIIIAEFGAGKIRFIKRDFPLVNLHQNAFRAAVAANAANAQGKFFEYVEILYQNQNSLDDESLKKYASNLGLNLRQFELDLENEKYTAEVSKDLADGKSYGVNSTPTIFINGVKVRILSAESFRKAIQRALQN